jgi:CheY-like chemotaxis protein
MSRKFLVADDSSTIQKVIRIALADRPYKLIECLTTEKLLSSIGKGTYDLLLLDFSLSLEMDGHQLLEKVRDKGFAGPVVLMHGTLETIKEERLKSFGPASAISKPFDSGSLVNLCEKLLGEKKGEEVPAREIPMDSVQDSETELPDEDFWTLHAPAGAANGMPLSSSLKQEVPMPGVIGETEGTLGTTPLPPVIASAHTLSAATAEWLGNKEEQAIKGATRDPLDELEFFKKALEKVEQKPIEEISDSSLDNFWAVDGSEKLAAGATPAALPDGLEAKIDAMIRSLLREYCRETVERVAWEVIPDLAENLIKKELGRISETVHE